MTQRLLRRKTGVPPLSRQEFILNCVARFRLLPTQVAIGFSKTSDKTTRATLKWMEEEKLLRKQTYGHAYSHQLRSATGYYLSAKAVKNFECVSWCTAKFTTTPNDRLALWAFHRSHLTLALHKDGYSVGRSSQHLLALRRNLVDRQRRIVTNLSGAAKVAAEKVLYDLRMDEDLLPATQVYCERCGAKSRPGKSPRRLCRCSKEHMSRTIVEGQLRCRRCKALSYGWNRTGCCPTPRLHREDAAAYDIAVNNRPASGTPSVAIVVVDHPGSSVERTLRELPLRIRGQPKIPIILRPSSVETAFDVESGRYKRKDARFARIMKAFSPEMDRRVSQFPYHTTSKVLTYRPTIGQRTA